MDINEIKKLKSTFFKSDKELHKFLKSITTELLNSKVKEKTLSPILLTHKEFIDTSLAKLLKNIKEKLFVLAKKHNMPLGDKIFEIKLEYLAGYILKYDMANDMIIHKTIAKYILNIIRKDALKLNHFVSTLNREIYTGKFGKFKYPPLYPYDKNRFNNPIPPLKSLLNKIDTIKKTIQTKENLLEQLKSEFNQTILEINQIKIAAKDMKDIVSTLKNKYKDKPLKDRLAMIKNQHTRFDVLLQELSQKHSNYKKEIKTLSKNIEAIKEKNKELLQKEEEIIQIIANNLKTMKQKV